MSEILLTQEVGSLAKPDYRVAAVAGRELTKEHVKQASYWSNTLGLDPIEAEDIVCQARNEQRNNGSVTVENISNIRKLAAEQAIKLQEKAGLDIIYDGEQDRSEMYQHAVTRTNGFENRGLVRAFDNRTYKKSAVVNTPSITEPWHTEEITRLKELTTKQIKVPITGAYTIADWSYDEYYKGNKKDLVHSLAENVIRPNIISLLDQGVEWIQIDEPAAGTKSDETEIIVDSFNESTKDLLGKFSLHLCFSDWNRLFPEFEKLENCSQFSIEFANRDSKNLGITCENRPAYEILNEIHQSTPNTSIGLGVVSIHDDDIESPELIRDRILRAVDLVGDPCLIYPSPDCGLRTRNWNVAYEKLARLVEGTKLSKEYLEVA